MTNNLKINQLSGLIEPTCFKCSPHQDARPMSEVIDMIVVHGMSLPPGEFGGSAIEQFFCGQLSVKDHPFYAQIGALRVSAHLLIKREGEVMQFVPFTARAWHAGESFFRGRTHCNDFSIGIELEGTDDLPYTLKQYDTLAQITRLLMDAYPSITPSRVVGHSDIAPTRKTDPGPLFDWVYFKGMLK